MEPLCQSSKANGCDEHGNPTPEKEQSVASEPKTSGPPAPTEESKERYRQAQLAQQERLREQAERMERHRAEANYGMATSARPAVPMVMGPPPVPKPSAKKASQPSGGDFVNLYRSLRPSPYHGRYPELKIASSKISRNWKSWRWKMRLWFPMPVAQKNMAFEVMTKSWVVITLKQQMSSDQNPGFLRCI